MSEKKPARHVTNKLGPEQRVSSQCMVLGVVQQLESMVAPVSLTQQLNQLTGYKIHIEREDGRLQTAPAAGSVCSGNRFVPTSAKRRCRPGGGGWRVAGTSVGAWPREPTAQQLQPRYVGHIHLHSTYGGPLQCNLYVVSLCTCLACASTVPCFVFLPTYAPAPSPYILHPLPHSTYKNT